MPYKGVNVLEDEGIRQGIKDYSNWPTIPQLYVKGEFVGGCDITREMFQAGELQQLFADKGIRSSRAPERHSELTRSRRGLAPPFSFEPSPEGARLMSHSSNGLVSGTMICAERTDKPLDTE